MNKQKNPKKLHWGFLHDTKCPSVEPWHDFSWHQMSIMETMVWVHDTDLVLFLIMTILAPYGSVVRRAFQGHEMYCHNLESWVQTLVGLNLWCVVLLSRTWTKNISTTTPAKNKLMSIFNISVTITAGAKTCAILTTRHCLLSWVCLTSDWFLHWKFTICTLPATQKQCSEVELEFGVV